MFKQTCEIVSNVKVAPGHWVLTLRSPAIAKAAKPGQFVQILCADGSLDPLLGRPFSFLTAAAQDFSILYHVVGKGTELLSKTEKGEVLRVLGPLGNGFDVGAGLKPAPTGAKQLILVGGGVGIPPLLHLAQALVKAKPAFKKNVHVMLGARNKSLLLCEADFKKLGVNLVLTTDDGSKGKKGLVTGLLAEFLKKSDASKTRVFTCGPTPMLKAVSALAVQAKVPCEISVEVPMACGFGACLGCAIKVKSRATCATEGSAKLPARLHPEEPRPSGDEGSKADYRFAIACTEGPVFSASELVWD